MKTLLKTRKNEVGATAIEYGLIAALISVAIIAAVSTVGTDLKSVFTSVGSSLAEASSAG
ncbi:Flp family type IVb pilin [Komagataeibacter diospyri]|uniref:Flp family type IVb pilin n=1 Tax=Komagataeibacter diospyri TaxID=1932662 RepID=UPI0011430EDC|nr:Flp family type IVb pilin [Komagataeibacter diospyri]